MIDFTTFESQVVVILSIAILIIIAVVFIVAYRCGINHERYLTRRDAKWMPTQGKLIIDQTENADKPAIYFTCSEEQLAKLIDLIGTTAVLKIEDLEHYVGDED